MFWWNTLLVPGAVSIQPGQKQNSAILGALDVLWSTQSLHLSDISGSIQMKRIPYMQSIPVFWKLQPCSWGLWRENHLESHVHSEHRLWFDNADSFQLNVGASRVLQEACPAPGFQQRYHFHTFSKQLAKVFLQMQHSWCRNVFCGWVVALWARISWEEKNSMKKKFYFSLCCDIFISFVVFFSLIWFCLLNNLGILFATLIALISTCFTMVWIFGWVVAFSFNSSAAFQHGQLYFVCVNTFCRSQFLFC